MLSFSKTDFLSSPGNISHSLYSRAFLEPEAYFNIQSVFQLSCTEPLIPDLGHKDLHCSHAPVTQPLPEETGVVTGTNVLVISNIWLTSLRMGSLEGVIVTFLAPQFHTLGN